LLKVGFWAEELKLLGPAQLYPPPPVADKLSTEPVQIALVVALLVAVTMGLGFTITETVAVPVQLFSPVTVTEYTPDIAVLAAERVGFWVEAENALGPAQT
jgi:hypothetical protein